MTNVSPELKQLFRSGELASRPSDVDRERVFRQLESRLGITFSNSGDVGNVAVPKNPGRSLITRIVGISAAALVVATGGVALMNSVTPKRPPEVENTTSKLAMGAGLASATVEAPTTTLQQHSAQPDDVRAPAADLPNPCSSTCARSLLTILRPPARHDCNGGRRIGPRGSRRHRPARSGPRRRARYPDSAADSQVRSDTRRS